MSKRFGGEPQSIKNCCIAWNKDDFKFFRPYTRRKRVDLSTHIKVYLIPPRPTVGPYPISMFQVSLNLEGSLVGLVLRRADFIVAKDPSNGWGLVSRWIVTVGCASFWKFCSNESGFRNPID